MHFLPLCLSVTGLSLYPSSLQVEVTISLVPPVANAGWHKLVLILSSAVPVNWALTVPGLRGHISVYVRTLSSKT